MTENIFDVTLEDFARSFGTSVNEFSDNLKSFITKTDFRYRSLDGEEKEQVILEIIKKIEADTQIIGAPERQDVWEKGWEENLNDFIESGCDIDKLVPRFIRPNMAIRLNQQYIMPLNPNFELDYFSVFRHWLFEKYMKDYDSIYEFGCGTGFNLVELTRLYPQKKLYGTDFVPASVSLVNKLGKSYNWPIKGYLFDMLSPDKNLKIDNNSVFFTIGAIEQLASKFESFLQYILEVSPRLCVHVEPTVELYDENNLSDYLAIKFHRKRGYTEGLLPRLKELEAQNRIELLKVKRLYFGSLYMEGYNCLIWRPL